MAVLAGQAHGFIKGHSLAVLQPVAIARTMGARNGMGDSRMAAAAQKLANWFARQAKILLAFGVGVAFGVALRFPTGWALPDNTASMIGSLIGAFATAAAVVIGIELQSKNDDLKREKDQVEIRQRMMLYFMPFIGDLRIYFDNFSDKSKRHQAAKNMRKVIVDRMDQMQKDAHISSRLDNDGYIRYACLAIRMDALKIICDGLIIVGEKYSGDKQDSEFEHYRMEFVPRYNELIADIGSISRTKDLDVWRVT